MTLPDESYYSVPGVDAGDEAAVTTRMAELIRNHNLSCIELSDDLDENGNVQVRFYGSPGSVAAAVSEVMS